MEKIISLFQRNYETDRRVRNEVVPGAEWVLAGEGVATRKFDGTCCMIKDGVLWKRFDAKRGKTPPDGFMPATGTAKDIFPNGGFCLHKVKISVIQGDILGNANPDIFNRKE